MSDEDNKLKVIEGGKQDDEPKVEEPPQLPDNFDEVLEYCKSFNQRLYANEMSLQNLLIALNNVTNSCIKMKEHIIKMERKIKQLEDENNASIEDLKF